MPVGAFTMLLPLNNQLALHQIHTPVALECNSLRTKQCGLFGPARSGAPLAVHHAVARQIEFRCSTMKHPADKARVVGMAYKPCYLAVSKHPSARNGGNNRINFACEFVFVKHFFN